MKKLTVALAASTVMIGMSLSAIPAFAADAPAADQAASSTGNNLTYTASGLPPGLTLDPIAGTIAGTLPNTASSTTPYNVTVTASDGQLTN
ncbi:MAG: putative Ig domain-containing protein, partial [Steroidobacteraceae bacterium]